jgi:hypothetical protein
VPQYENDEFSIAVYPVPTKDKLVINYSLANPSKVQIDLMDISGKKLVAITDTKKLTGEYKETIDLNELHLAPNVYLIKFTVAGTTYLKRVILTD